MSAFVGVVPTRLLGGYRQGFGDHLLMGEDLRLAVVRREGAVAFLCASAMQRLMPAIDHTEGSTRGCP